jgi:hypothetical protein
MINKLFIFFIFYSLSFSQMIRDDNNKVIFDTASKLMWQDDNNVLFEDHQWESAISYCDNLSLAGKTDWRLPNINELYSIVDFTKNDPSISAIFVNTITITRSKKFWSSTTSQYDKSNAWYIDFGTGSSAYQTKKPSSDEPRVRCVRDIN